MLEGKRYRTLLQQVRRGEHISTSDDSVNIKDTENALENAYIVLSKRLDSEGIFDAIVRYFLFISKSILNVSEDCDLF